MPRPDRSPQGSLRADLHRHLLGSARVETLWWLAQKYKVGAENGGLQEFRNRISHRVPPRSLDNYIKPWTVFREVVREAEDVARIAQEAAEDACNDGVRYVEFRSSLPGLPATDGQAPQTRIPTTDYLKAIQKGFSNVTGVVCVLVVSIPRHAFGFEEPDGMRRYTAAFLDAITEFRDLVVGVDLTGIERRRPASLFRPLFQEARAAGFPVTAHAGETEGPESIWRAVEDLGASRIGHGTSAPRDPALVAELIERGIVLEVCPTSTWLVSGSHDRGSHPIINSDAPIPYVICTDNPTVNGSILSHELSIAAEIAGQPVDEFTGSQWQIALRAAFVPEILERLPA